MKTFLVTEVFFHVAYLVQKLQGQHPNFGKEYSQSGIIVRNNKKLDPQKLTAVHSRLRGKKSLTPLERADLCEAYGCELSAAELELISMHGVPEVHALSLPVAYSVDNLNAPDLLSSLEAESKNDKLAAVIFLDCILKSEWLRIFENRVVNAHSAILPRARGMYAIEQISAQGDAAQFSKAAGASIHYIDEKVDVGQLIAVQPLLHLWKYDNIWQVKAASYLTAFDLMVNYLSRPTRFCLQDGAPYTEAIGPVFRAKEFTEEIRSRAMRNFDKMRQEQNVLLNRMATVQQITDELAKPTVDVNVNSNGFNALHAAITNPIDVSAKIKLLVKVGVDVNSQNHRTPFRNTPLHVAIANEAPEIAILYIDICIRFQRDKFDLNAVDIENKTPLILAAKTRMSAVALHIIQVSKEQNVKVNLDAQDNYGRTALHYAVILGLPALVDALVKAGAKTSIIDRQGKKPLEYVNCGDQDIVDVLSSVAIDPLRDEYALSNFVQDENKQPLMLIPKKIPFDKVDLCEIPSQKDQKGVAQHAMSKGLVDTTVFALEDKIVPMSERTRSYILGLFDKMSGRTLLDSIKEGHLLVRLQMLKILTDETATVNASLSNNTLASDSPINNAGAFREVLGNIITPAMPWKVNIKSNKAWLDLSDENTAAQIRAHLEKNYGDNTVGIAPEPTESKWTVIISGLDYTKLQKVPILNLPSPDTLATPTLTTN